MKKNKQALVGISIVVGWSILFGVALAYKLSVPFPGATEITAPGKYIQTVYTFALGFGTLLAMAMIIFGAVEYTLSEAVTKKEDAKDRIMGAVWGLVLLLTATLILNTINPELPELREPPLVTLPPPATYALPPAPLGSPQNVYIVGNAITWQYTPSASSNAEGFIIQYRPPGASNWLSAGEVSGANTNSFVIPPLPLSASSIGQVIQFRVVPVENGQPNPLQASNPIPFTIGGGGGKNN